MRIDQDFVDQQNEAVADQDQDERQRKARVKKFFDLLIYLVLSVFHLDFGCDAFDHLVALLGLVDLAQHFIPLEDAHIIVV